MSACHSISRVNKVSKHAKPIGAVGARSEWSRIVKITNDIMSSLQVYANYYTCVIVSVNEEG